MQLGGGYGMQDGNGREAMWVWMFFSLGGPARSCGRAVEFAGLSARGESVGQTSRAVTERDEDQDGIGSPRFRL